MSTGPWLLVVLGGLGWAVGAVANRRLGATVTAAGPAHRYRVFELANAALWIAAGVRFGAHLIVVPYVLFFSVLLALSVIDLERYLLPNRITYPAIVCSLVAIPVVSLAAGHPRSMLGAVVGGAGYFVFLFIPAVLYPKGMGFGDVKLAGLMGLYLGWIHPALALPALVMACGIGVLAGVVLLVRRGTSSPYPFGPWLALGCVLAVLFSRSLLSASGY